MRDGTSEVTPLNWKGSADQSTWPSQWIGLFPAGEQPMLKALKSLCLNFRHSRSCQEGNGLKRTK